MNDTTRIVLIAAGVTLLVVILVPILLMAGMMSAMMGGMAGGMGAGRWLPILLILLLLGGGITVLTIGLGGRNRRD